MNITTKETLLLALRTKSRMPKRCASKSMEQYGETGRYYAIPKNIVSLAGMKEINVTKYWDEDLERWEREIEMQGSYY